MSLRCNELLNMMAPVRHDGVLRVEQCMNYGFNPSDSPGLSSTLVQRQLSVYS